MPELPEVELAARSLRRWAGDRTLVAVEAEPTRVLRPAGPAALRPLVGARLGEVRRIGKNLLLGFEGARGPVGAWSHLGMTGKWLRRAPGEPPPRHSRLRLRLDDGATLHYVDQRLFGRFRMVPHARFDEVPELAALGPDPLEQGIDGRRLADMLARTSRPVKVALLDQALLPGVGNIYACEALFRARIDPRRPARSLARAEVDRLARAVLASMRASLRQLEQRRGDVTYVEEGAPNPFAVYDRAGERCPRCGRAKIERVALGGRGTFFCPRCPR
jgi:formamidopyrimidine-DNA glycosylase